MAVGEVTSKLSERNNRENGHRVAENIYIPINKNFIFFKKNSHSMWSVREAPSCCRRGWSFGGPGCCPQSGPNNNEKNISCISTKQNKIYLNYPRYVHAVESPDGDGGRGGVAAAGAVLKYRIFSTEIADFWFFGSSSLRFQCSVPR